MRIDPWAFKIRELKTIGGDFVINILVDQCHARCGRDGTFGISDTPCSAASVDGRFFFRREDRDKNTALAAIRSLLFEA